MENFIACLPKAELHLHIEGTLEPELMFSLAARNAVPLEYKSIEEVRRAYEFHNLQSFLDIYYTGAKVLINQQDFYELTWAYLQRAKENHIRHAEIFFDPQTHIQRNVSFATVITGIHKALEDAKDKLGISSHLILCFLRDLSAESAMQTLEQALPFKKWIKAVGLDSAEIGHPPSKFEKIFTKARAEGFLTVAHAGEEGPADYIWQALQLCQVSRIDHGVRCFEDTLLVAELIKQQIPLTMCPLSNVKLQVFSDMKQHPLKQGLDQGLCVTVNSDDPAYFSGYVNENFFAIQKAFSLTAKELYQLAKNSFNASFLSAQEKQIFIEELDYYYQSRQRERFATA